MKRYVPVFAIAFVLIGAVIVATSMHQYWLKEGLAVIWTDDIDALSDEICDDADNDKEKVQAIYHWITNNIRYDYEAEMVYQNVDISRTVETKRGICFDYATLFAALCRSQGIPCFILDGYSRDNSSYKHTWNRVYYDNRYWNLDVTYDYMLKAKHGLAIVLFAQNEETGKYDVSYPFVTKSFGEFIGMKNSVYIDLNNCPFAVDLLKQGFAEDTGLTKHSGRCVYPLWTFKEEFLKEIGAENYKIYSDEFDHYMKGVFGDEDEEF